MVHEAGSAAEEKMSDTRQGVEEDLALLLTPIKYADKYMTVVRQIVLKAMCDTQVLVFTQVAGLIEVIMHENVAKNHVYMTAKGIVDVYLDRPF